MTSRGLTLETIERAQLGWDRRESAIAIPVFDARGECRQLRLRYLAPDARPKYKTVPHGTGRHLWGIEATQEPHVFITEGEFDAMILRQLGHATVAYAGANNFVKSWAWLFRDCDLVTIVGDGDDEGKKAMYRVKTWIGAIIGDSVRDLHMPLGHDVSSLFLEDPNRLKELL